MEHDAIADQITRLARGCADPLMVAALDLAAATHQGDPAAQRDSLAHLLSLAGERLLPEADRAVQHWPPAPAHCDTTGCCWPPARACSFSIRRSVPRICSRRPGYGWNWKP